MARKPGSKITQLHRDAFALAFLRCYAHVEGFRVAEAARMGNVFCDPHSKEIVESVGGRQIPAIVEPAPPPSIEHEALQARHKYTAQRLSGSAVNIRRHGRNEADEYARNAMADVIAAVLSAGSYVEAEFSSRPLWMTFELPLSTVARLLGYVVMDRRAAADSPDRFFEPKN